MTEKQNRWAFHLSILAMAAGIHSVCWWIWQGGRGKIAELPGWLQHVAGVGTGAMISYTLLPILLLIVIHGWQARGVLRPRVVMQLTWREWGRGIAALLKVGGMIGIFGVWMPWTFWVG
ncbi:hypothetical protein [Halomonas sp. I5-271120]|uniref:hypothetical protein n=1 Tax=Halomonas sp. I5-271120 TaxID=3061632 RepID=UPI00271450E4|nr:hypothetical protein [Halomonas sp. I5-271120]